MRIEFQRHWNRLKLPENTNFRGRRIGPWCIFSKVRRWNQQIFLKPRLGYFQVIWFSAFSQSNLITKLKKEKKKKNYLIKINHWHRYYNFRFFFFKNLHQLPKGPRVCSCKLSGQLFWFNCLRGSVVRECLSI